MTVNRVLTAGAVFGEPRSEAAEMLAVAVKLPYPVDGRRAELARQTAFIEGELSQPFRSGLHPVHAAATAIA